jgi:hypothetical protein
MRLLFKIIIVSSLFLVASVSGEERQVIDLECKKFEEQISDDIGKSATCTSVEECKSVWLGCPFGCGNAVRSSEELRITKLVDEFNKNCPTCKYMCPSVDTELKCINSRCVLKAKTEAERIEEERECNENIKKCPVMIVEGKRYVLRNGKWTISDDKKK